MALKPWEVLLIVIGGLIVVFLIYRVTFGRKVDNSMNSDYFTNARLNTARGSVDSLALTVVSGGKRKRKLRRKPRR